MYDYIKGKIEELQPAEAVIDCNGIGFQTLISLQTYESLNGKEAAKIFIHHYLREDEELLYGFATKDERELFRLLIGVSGVGAATARMMLSSLTDDEIRNAIISEDVHRIKAVKGIGLKTAQRLILELKDKIIKGGGVDNSSSNFVIGNEIVNEAVSALVMLGFSKPNINKILPDILKNNPNAKVEDIIKAALQRL